MTQPVDGRRRPSAAHRRDGVIRLLDRARERGEAVPPPGPMPLEEGYRIQDELARRRIESGEEHAGYKVGLTSAAARSGLGAHEPGRGHLFARDLRRSSSLIPLGPFAMRYEVELAVRVNRAVSPDDPRSELLDKIDVAAALELIATRWDPPTADIGVWAADNALAEAAVVGDFMPGAGLSDHVTVVDGVHEPRGFAVQDALDSLAWLARHLGRSGGTLTPGNIVLTGAIIGPEPIIAGQTVRALIEGIGAVSAEFR